MGKPKVFIGSSVEGLNIAYAVHQNLHHYAEVTVWDQGIFELSKTTIESLVEILDKSDFGVFIFSPDDIVKIRTKKHLAVRDNVIFELGLFVGRLGRERAFILIPEKTDFHLPTDLLGVTPGVYEKDRTDGSFQSATGPACQQIRTSIEKLGHHEANISDRTDIVEQKQELVKEEDKNTDWINLFVDKKWVEGIKIIEKLLKKEKAKNELMKLTCWKCYGQYMIDPVNGLKEFEVLIAKNKKIDTPSVTLARTLRWQGLHSKAISEIDKALKNFKNNKRLIIEKVKCLQALGDTDSLKELLNSQLSHEKDETYYLELFDVFNSEKKYESAKEIINEAYNIYPNSEQILFKYARLVADNNDKKLSLYLMKKLVGEYPDSSSYFGYLGNAYFDLEFYNAALASYQKAKELSNSKETWILENIGNVLKNQGFPTEGAIYLKEAIKLSPLSEYSHNRLSTCLKSEEEEENKIKEILKEAAKMLYEYNESLENKPKVLVNDLHQNS